MPVPPDSTGNAGAALRAAMYAERPLQLVGTINAYTQPGQAELVRHLLGKGIPLIIIALRLPYDLAAFPEAPTYLCTYSIQEPSMQAAARALFGQAGMNGLLPVTIPAATNNL